MEDCDQSKVFVGGISWETTEDVLREHFRSYGTVVGSVIAKDRMTGSPRGFAFVSFSDASALDRVLVDTHNILGRTVEVKKAVPRSEQNQNQQEPNRGQNRNCRNNGTKTHDNLKTKKIFVGGLSANLTEDDFKFYFEKFGKITDVVVMHDNVTHRPRGFGFITFDTEDSVEEVMQKNFHELCGKLVEVKRAVPKEITGGISGGTTSGNRDSSFGGGGGQPAAQYRPSYEVLPGYRLFPGYSGGYPYGGGMFGGGGGYPVGGYGLAARVPWGGPAMVGMRGGPGPLPMAFYPGYVNGGPGLMGMAVNGGNGIMGPVPGVILIQLSGNVDNNYFGSTGGNVDFGYVDQSGVEGNMN
ncbi:heterogeneous nuclear ribonucleoprotein 1-like [Bidens hawaiensis]|uniref:heterogeneous nuclear ribonucleoprotein 1-like n=1 Tax=Bidens hawaiensis TaxID=980011 RepID=UPI004049C51A